MKKLNIIVVMVIIILAVAVGSRCFAADVTLQWSANTEPDLAAYNVYIGLESGIYEEPILVPLANLSDIENPEYTVTGLTDNTFYFFAIKAVDTESLESDFSNEVLAEDGLPPGGVQNCQIIINTNTVIINTND